MANLNEAVQLIRQGRKAEARRILEPLLKADPKDIQNWFWYVETCSTLEQRIKTLEVCLKVNPGHPQVLQALRTLQAKQGAAITPPAQPAPPPAAKNDEIPDWARRPAAEQPVDSQLEIPQATFESTSAFSFDDEALEPDQTPIAETSSGGWQQPRGESRPAFDWEALEREANPGAVPVTVADVPVSNEQARFKEPKLQPRARSLPFYDVWLTALTTQDARVYASLLDDPDAGAGRAFEWMAYVGAVTGLLTPVLFLTNPQFAELRAMPEFQNMAGGLSTPILLVIMGLIMAVVSPIMGVLSLAINGGFQHLLAGLFGGRGTFGRTVYALAAYLAPFSLVTTLVNIIPYVGSCLSIPIGIYAIILNVRALQAAHGLPTMRAAMVLFAPGILVFLLLCLLGALLGPAFTDALRSISN